MIALAVTAACVALIGLLVLGFLRQAIPLLESAENAFSTLRSRLAVAGLPAGMRVPTFNAQTIDGEFFADRDLLGTPSVVLFLEESCRGCRRLLASLAANDMPQLPAQIILVGDERDRATFAKARQSGAVVLIQAGGSISRIFESDRTPHMFVLDEDAIVRASGTPNTWAAIEELVAAAQKGGVQEVAAAVI
jgi:peroxiredoxin